MVFIFNPRKNTMTKISEVSCEEDTGIKCYHCGRNLLYDRKTNKFKECVCSDDELKKVLK